MTAVDYHASAADHHDQAARFHRQASKHFKVGKDPEHWAHQALLAHGHTLRAIESGNAARKYYAKYDAGALQKYSDTLLQFPSNAFERAEAMGSILQGGQRHAVAADHHEEAAKHHGRASKYCVARNYTPANHEAQMAYRHARQSLFQSHEAAKQHVCSYLRNTPTAEAARPMQVEKARS